MDNKKTTEFVNRMWDDEIVPEISEYIKVPNKSPIFDPDWEKNGHMEKAVQMLDAWCRTQPIKDMTVEIVRIEGRTPVVRVTASTIGTSWLESEALPWGRRSPQTNPAPLRASCGL